LDGSLCSARQRWQTESKRSDGRRGKKREIYLVDEDAEEEEAGELEAGWSPKDPASLWLVGVPEVGVVKVVREAEE
jgi:hypothetical protein